MVSKTVVSKKTRKQSSKVGINISSCNFFPNPINYFLLCKAKKKKMCLRSPDPPYFSAADPNLFNQQLLDPNFC